MHPQHKDSDNVDRDSINYVKNDAYVKHRTYNSDLKDKYSGNDFNYIEDMTMTSQVSQTPAEDFDIIRAFSFFMKTVFPFILGALIIFMIVNLVLGGSISHYWKFQSRKKASENVLIFEEENIEHTNFNSLLKHALENKNSRLAIRYYYLLTLKKLSDKNLINYHIDKTNSDYLFELKDASLKQQFSYLSYIYSYVWYGEFILTATEFSEVQATYKLFLKTIS